MIDDRDLFSRERNYTASENQPAGMRIPEYVFAQLIGFAMQNIRDTLDTSKLIDELFAYTSEGVVKRIKKYLREHKNLFVSVNWPQQDVHLPLIACINQGEQEDTSNAFLGDLIGQQRVAGVAGDARVVERTAFAVPMRGLTNIYIASQDDDLTMYLYNIVRFVILSNKLALEHYYDIRNLTLSGQSLEFDESKHPSKGFYRVCQLSYNTLFDWNMSEEAAKIVSVELLVEALAAGELATSEVPDPGV